MSRSILWLRRDLRRADHPALLQAAQADCVLPVFVVDPHLAEVETPRRQAIFGAVAAARERFDGHLTVRTGSPADVIAHLVRETGATSVHVSAETTPYGRRRDAAVAEALHRRGVPLVATGTPYAIGPGVLRTRQGGGYRVFTPFCRAWRDHGAPSPAIEPAGLRLASAESDDAPIPATAPTRYREDTALEQWSSFRDNELSRYHTDRDRPDLDATSRLSTALKLGLIHPRTLLADLADLATRRDEGATRFVTELAWREFYADVLWHHPASAWNDLTDSLAGMRYDDPATDPVAAERLAAWQHGMTGFPIVDAGMRQLLAEGWMHNRVRMIVASFLVKDLHIWWPHGARHFMAQLTDGDLASNSHGWQWVAGTGTDAAPYFRVFNPTRQAATFDPDGAYVRRYLPRIDDGSYSAPIVDHAEERREALARYQEAKAR